MTLRWLAFFFILSLFSAFARAQGTGRITGRVTDAETGEALPGVEVVVPERDAGAVTDADGLYTINGVPAGTVTLRLRYVGYVTQLVEEIAVRDGETVVLEVALTEDILDEDAGVCVCDPGPLDPRERRLDYDELIQPPTRDPATYYTIQPGVNVWNGNVHVRGGRPEETDYLLEGMEIRSLLGTGQVLPVFEPYLFRAAGISPVYGGYNLLPLIPDALEEVEVLTGGYDVDQGNAGAGIGRQTLRKGGYRLEGSARYEGDLGAGAMGYGYRDLTGTLSGPLFSGRLHFFAAANYRNTDDYAPMFWSGADLGTPVDEITNQPAPTPIRWEDGRLPGIGRPLDELRLNGTLEADLFRRLRLRAIFAQAASQRRLNPQPVYTYFNQERIPERGDLTRLASLRASYATSPQTFFQASAGFLQNRFEIFDPSRSRPEADGDGGAVLDAISYYSGTTGEYLFNGFRFQQAGAVTTAYQRRDQGYGQAGLSMTSQLSKRHQVKAGGLYRQWTVREYALDAGGLAVLAAQTPAFLDAVRSESAEAARQIRLEGYGGTGYDEFMNPVESGPNAARRPSTATLYVQEQFESRYGIIARAGLRYDRFDMDLRRPANPASPEYRQEQADVTGLERTGVSGVLQPRLALTYYRSIRTRFHASLGRYAQMPDLSAGYRSRAVLATVLGGQFYTPDPLAWNLDPIRTNQAEIGLSRSGGYDSWGVDVSLYMRKTAGLPELAVQQTLDAGPAHDYLYYTSTGEAMAQGLELSATLKRTGPLSGAAHYSLARVRGGGSRPNDRAGALVNGFPAEGLDRPLAYQPAHRGVVALNAAAPETASLLTSGWAAHLLLQFRSGTRYTLSGGAGGAQGPEDLAILEGPDARSRTPLEPVNASTTPWAYNLDLGIERGLALGPARATLYAYALNLLNTKQVLNVYLRSGETEDDGFLSNPALSGHVIQANGPEFVRYYEAANLANRQHYVNATGTDLYGSPRQVRLGARLEF